MVGEAAASARAQMRQMVATTAERPKRTRRALSEATTPAKRLALITVRLSTLDNWQTTERVTVLALFFTTVGVRANATL